MTEVLPTPAEAEGFASVERNFAKVDGLVVPIQRGQRQKGFELHYPSRGEFNSDGFNFTFRIYQQLGAWDESVLLVVLKLLGQRGVMLDPNPTGPNSRLIRQKLEAEGEALLQATLLLQASSHTEILRHMGLSPVGRARRLLRDSLQRLSAITLWVKHRGGSEGSSNLLVARVAANGELQISVHYLLARSFLAESLWVRINLSERWKLASDISKILHRWLSAWLGEGETQSARLSTLERHVWGNVTTGPERAKRFSDLREAFREIQAIGTGWKMVGADQRGDCTCRITRPPRGTPIEICAVPPLLEGTSEASVNAALLAETEEVAA